MHTGANLEDVQAYNHRIVFDMVRLSGPISRASIARKTGLTKPTVSNIIKYLSSQGLVLEKGERQSSQGGKPAIELEINPLGAYTVGLHLSRDRLTGVLVNLAGVVRQRVHYNLEYPKPDEALPLMQEATEYLLAAYALNREQLWGVGVGLPGPLNTSDRKTVYPHDFAGWHNVPVIDLLKERLNLPIYVENNATAAAIGERWHGAGKRVENFFFIHFDAGLGGGLILNGRPYYGFSGNAGELGFLPTFAEGRVLNKIGSYVSLAALYRTLRNQGETRTEPASLEILYTEGHSGLLEWLDATSRYLAPVLIIVENLFDPEAFFFGGRLPKPLTEHIIKGLNVLMSPLRIQGKRYTPALQAAEAGEDAAALGSATLPIYEHFVPDAKLPLRIGRGPTLPA